MVYEAQVGRTQRGFPCLIYESRREPGRCYVYQKVTRRGNQAVAYRCSGCQKYHDNGHKDFPVLEIKVNEETFAADPEDQNHQCERLTVNAVRARQTYRKVIAVNKNSNKSGSELMRNLTNEMLEQYEEQSLDIASEMNTKWTSMKRNLKRAAEPEIVYECTMTHIAPELRASKMRNSGDILKIFRMEPRPLLFMMDNNAIRIIQNCKYLVMDGTFEKRPRDAINTFVRTYTIVAVYHDLPSRLETFAVGIAFLSRKTKAVYTELFECLRDALGNLGINKELRFDQEQAAISAATDVFPWRIRSCFFHYQKNLKDHAKNHLGPIFSKNIWFQRWLRRVMGASHLPNNELPNHQPSLMRRFIEHQLQNPPDLNDPVLNAHFQSFIQYYRGQWMDKLEFVNYYDDDGPRTTNGCEGFHSRLKHLIKSTTPDFKTCYTEFRDILTDDYFRFAFTRFGDPLKLKSRHHTFVDSEARIREAKSSFANHLINHPNPDMDHLSNYCRHQAYNSCPDFIRTHEDAQFLLPEENQLLQQVPEFNMLIQQAVDMAQAEPDFLPVPQDVQQQPVRLIFQPQIEQHQLFARPRLEQRHQFPVQQQQRFVLPRFDSSAPVPQPIVDPVVNRFELSVPVPHQFVRFPVQQHQQQPIRLLFPNIPQRVRFPVQQQQEPVRLLFRQQNYRLNHFDNLANFNLRF